MHIASWADMFARSDRSFLRMCAVVAGGRPVQRAAVAARVCQGLVPSQSSVKSFIYSWHMTFHQIWTVGTITNPYFQRGKLRPTEAE